MFCTSCGSQIAEGQNTCSVCGAVITQQAEYNPQMQYGGQQYNQQMQYGGQQQYNQQIQYGGQQQYNQQMQYGGQQQFNKPMYPGLAGPNMGWFQFIIWFQLFASALSVFFTGAACITGSQYKDDNGNFVSALVYNKYQGLEMLDKLYALCCFALVIYTIYVRFRLAGFKKNGPKCYYIYLIISMVMSLVYVIGAIVITGISLRRFNLTSYAISFVINIVMLLINYVYFNNRKDMFVN